MLLWDPEHTFQAYSFPETSKECLAVKAKFVPQVKNINSETFFLKSQYYSKKSETNEQLHSLLDGCDASSDQKT